MGQRARLLEHIADRTLKYVAWGDGYADVRLDAGGDGGFTAWYGDADGACVGVLCHRATTTTSAGASSWSPEQPAP